MKTFTNSITYKNIKHECVQFVITNAFRVYYYAYSVLKGSWADVGRPEVEDVIKQVDFYRIRYNGIFK